MGAPFLSSYKSHVLSFTVGTGAVVFETSGAFYEDSENGYGGGLALTIQDFAENFVQLILDARMSVLAWACSDDGGEYHSMAIPALPANTKFVLRVSWGGGGIRLHYAADGQDVIDFVAMTSPGITEGQASFNVATYIDGLADPKGYLEYVDITQAAAGSDFWTMLSGAVETV